MRGFQAALSDQILKKKTVIYLVLLISRYEWRKRA